MHKPKRRLFMKHLYNFFIKLYGFIIKVSALFNSKAGKWVRGRHAIFEQLQDAIPPNRKIIWVHTASLGEFEQGRTLIEALRNRYTDYQILLTFFSPSGYEIRKDYDQVDFVFYLPLDTPKNARRFVSIVRPQFAIFVKYEFWYNYLHELHNFGSDIYYISSIFRKNQYFFKWYGKWFREQLKLITHFFVQTDTSADILNEIGIYNICISGDTRFDRVYQLSQKAEKFPLVEKFKSENKLFIAGSTWGPDESIIYPYIEKNPEIKFVIAPHDVNRADGIIKKLKNKAIAFSNVTDETLSNYQVLVIDSIGKLAHLYQYADICYIGGGFGSAIHNIQEPVTFGKPVMFGPKFEKFKEAVDLIERGGAFNVNNTEDLNQTAKKLLGNHKALMDASQTCKDYIDEMRGATQAVMNFLQINLK